MTLAVQVNGKLRDTLTAPRGLDRGRGRGARAGLGQGPAPARRRSAAQGDCRSRPAGEYRRMMRARSSSPCCLAALAGLRPAAALRRRRLGGPVAADAALGPGRADPGPVGLAGPQQARRPPRRDRERPRATTGSTSTLDDNITVVRHPRATARRPGAADAARALPAGRRRQAARSCSTRPPAPTRASTSSAREYATVAAEQTALEQLVRRSSPTRSSPGSRSTRARTDAGASEGRPRPVDRPRGRPARRDIRFYLFHGPDEAQSRALGGAAASRRCGASRFLIAGGGR